MKYIAKRIKIHFLLAVTVSMFILSSCNKSLEQFATPVVTPPSGLALGETIATIADDSLYYKMIVRSGMLATINNKSTAYTMFVPNNAAIRQFINFASGGLIPPGSPEIAYVRFIDSTLVVAAGPPPVLAGLSRVQAAGIVNYNMMAQTITTASVPNTFPNFFYPTNLNPTTGTAGFNPLVRLLTFPSTRNGNWVNNIPLLAVNLAAANGVIHTAAALPAPPTKVLAQRIFADPDMTYLAAAIQRADSGVAPTTSASLVWVLSNFGPNVTLFAPSNAAFQNLIFGLVYQQVFAATGNAALATATANGAVAAGPAFLSTNNVSTQLVKGIVVYHMLGNRAFTNNFPTTATSYPTLLNSAIPTHPGVSLTCTFTGPFVSAATVKGAANATASNIAINPTPEPGGTSDQFFVNGVIHKINQVMLPQ